MEIFHFQPWPRYAESALFLSVTATSAAVIVVLPTPPFHALCWSLLVLLRTLLCAPLWSGCLVAPRGTCQWSCRLILHSNPPPPLPPPRHPHPPPLAPPLPLNHTHRWSLTPPFRHPPLRVWVPRPLHLPHNHNSSRPRVPTRRPHPPGTFLGGSARAISPTHEAAIVAGRPLGRELLEGESVVGRELLVEGEQS